MNEWFVQGLGFAGMVLCIVCFQFKDTKKLLLVQIIGNLFYSVQFILLGAYSGCVTILLSTLCNFPLCLEREGRRAWKYWKWIFIPLMVCAGLLTWKNLFSILPPTAAVIFALANWTRSGRMIRLAKLLCGAPCWLIYDLHVQSWGGVMTEVFGICSTLISIYRHGWRNLGQQH